MPAIYIPGIKIRENIRFIEGISFRDQSSSVSGSLAILRARIKEQKEQSGITQRFCSIERGFTSLQAGEFIPIARRSE